VMDGSVHAVFACRSPLADEHGMTICPPRSRASALLQRVMDGSVHAVFACRSPLADEHGMTICPPRSRASAILQRVIGWFGARRVRL